MLNDPYIMERHRRKAAENDIKALWMYVAVLWVIIIIQMLIITAK